MKVKKVNHFIDLDNMALIEFQTEQPLKVNNEITTDLFRFDYDRESQKSHNVMVALQDSHFVSDNANHLFDFDLLESQLEDLLTDDTPNLTEEYKQEMEDEEEGSGWE